MKRISLFTSILKTFRHSVPPESSSSTAFLKPNPIYATLQDLCSKQKMTEVENVLDDMNQTGLAPDEKTYKSLFELIGDQLRNEKGYKILRHRVGAAGFSHSFATYNMIVLAYCNAGEVDEALEILRGMEVKGVKLDLVSVKAVLQDLYKDKRKTEAEELLKEMKGKGLATDNNIIVLASNVGMVDEAVEILRDMAEKGVEPDCLSFKAVLQGLCKNKRKTEAEDLLKEMKGKGLIIDDTLVHLISQYQEVYYLHTDARYYQHTGKGCIAGFFRDIRGNFLRSHYMKFGEAEKLLESGGSSKAEAIGVQQGLLEFKKWMDELGIPLKEVELRVMTNSKNVQNGVTKGSSKSTVVHKIRKQMKEYKRFEIKNVGKKFNLPTHALAKHGWGQEVRDRQCVIVKEVKELSIEIMGMLDDDKEHLTIFKENP